MKTYLLKARLIREIICIYSVFISLVSYTIIHRPGHDDIARMIERAFPHLKDRLISAVQLGRLHEDELQGQSKELVDALLSEVDEATSPLNLAGSVPVWKLGVGIKVLTGSVIVVFLLAAMFPDYLLGGLYRLADYSRPYVSPDTSTLYITDRKNSIIIGDSFHISGFFDGNVSGNLTVYYRWNRSRKLTLYPVVYLPAISPIHRYQRAS